MEHNQGRFPNHKNHPKLTPTHSPIPSKSSGSRGRVQDFIAGAVLLCAYPGSHRKRESESRGVPGSEVLQMEIGSARCECCGLEEDCTEEYIREVKASFQGKWLCGLCAEAARDELTRGRMMNKKKTKGYGVEEAVKAHMAFCRKCKSNPAVRVADGMRQMLRRRSADMTTSASGRRGAPASSSQTRDDSSVSLY